MLQQQGNNKPFIPEENAAGGDELEVRGGGGSANLTGEAKSQRGRERGQVGFSFTFERDFPGWRREKRTIMWDRAHL